MYDTFLGNMEKGIVSHVKMLCLGKCPSSIPSFMLVNSPVVSASAAEERTTQMTPVRLRMAP